MWSTGVRDVLQADAGERRIPARCVGKRNEADKTLVAVGDRQAADALVTNVVCEFRPRLQSNN